jgi:hypothetical protein
MTTSGGLAMAQTRAMTRPMRVQPSSRLTIKIACRLRLLRRRAAKLGCEIAPREEAQHDDREKHLDEQRQIICHQAQRWRDIDRKSNHCPYWRPDQRFHAGMARVKERIEELRAPLYNLKARFAEAFQPIGITVALERLREFGEHRASWTSAR